MRDYIAEANYFMYDDSYITESKVAVDGKKYASKKAAEEDLKKKGLKGKQVADKMAHSHEIKMTNDHKSILKDSEHHINKISKEIEKHENNMDKRGRKGDLANEFDFHRSQHDYDHDEHKKLHDKIKSAHEKGEKVSDDDIKKLKKHIELGRDMIGVAKSNENIKDNW
jgi:hypothetical protein